MLDMTAVAGMIFSLLALALIGGFILLIPLSRRLGDYLEQRLEQGRGAGPAAETEIQELRQMLAALHTQIEGISERQEFTERLLSREGQAVER